MYTKANCVIPPPPPEGSPSSKLSLLFSKGLKGLMWLKLAGFSHDNRHTLILVSLL